MTKTTHPVNAISLDKLNELIIEATVEKCASFTNSRILSAIKQRWTEVLCQRLDAVNRGEQITHPEASSVSLDHVGKDLSPQPVEEKQPVAEELSDNEFDDAEVETAQHQERPVEGLESAGAVESTAPADTVPPEPVSTVDREAATDDVEDDISISDVSDLDDREPETKDLVIGRLEKITRPSSKKAGAPTWKVKLKYGILQVNGLEVPFDHLEGEFEF